MDKMSSVTLTSVLQSLAQQPGRWKPALNNAALHHPTSGTLIGGLNGRVSTVWLSMSVKCHNGADETLNPGIVTTFASGKTGHRMGYLQRVRLFSAAKRVLDLILEKEAEEAGA